MIEEIIIGIIGILIFSFFAIIFTSLFEPELRREIFSKQIFKKTTTLSLAMIFYWIVFCIILGVPLLIILKILNLI